MHATHSVHLVFLDSFILIMYWIVQIMKLCIIQVSTIFLSCHPIQIQIFSCIFCHQVPSLRVRDPCQMSKSLRFHVITLVLMKIVSLQQYYAMVAGKQLCFRGAWRWRHYTPEKCYYLFTGWHDVTSLKTSTKHLNLFIFCQFCLPSH